MEVPPSRDAAFRQLMDNNLGCFVIRCPVIYVNNGATETYGSNATRTLVTKETLNTYFHIK